MILIKNMIRRSIIFFVSILNYVLLKNKKKILFHSFPDFSDSSYVVFKHIIEHTSEKMYKIIWLYNGDYQKSYQINDIIECNSNKHKIIIIKKKSITGLFNFLTSKYIFFTHGIYADIKIPDRQKVINLWHGVPIKKVGLLDNKKEVINFSSITSISKNYDINFQKIFGISKQQILNTGLPRTDFLYLNKNHAKRLGEKLDLNHFDKLLFWLPTYRISKVGDIRDDGELNKNGLPFFSSDKLYEFNQYLNSINYVMLVKLHPMDACNNHEKHKFSNIKFIDDELLFKKKIHLFNILAISDILLTDYSSVYIDFLQLNKPIAFLINDYKSINEKRGFIFENVIDYMPGKIIYDYNNLVKYIDDISKNIDNYKNEREKLNKYFNSYCDGKSTERLINYLKL